MYRANSSSGTYTLIGSNPNILVISNDESYDPIEDYLESEGFNITVDTTVTTVSEVAAYNPDIVLAEGYVWAIMTKGSGNDALLNDLYDAGYNLITQGNDQTNTIYPISSTTSSGSVAWTFDRNGSSGHPITEGWSQSSQPTDSGQAITGAHSKANILANMNYDSSKIAVILLQESGRGKWVHIQPHLPTSNDDRNTFLKNVVNYLGDYT